MAPDLQAAVGRQRLAELYLYGALNSVGGRCGRGTDLCGAEAGGLAAGVASVALHRGAAEGLGASGAVFCLEVRTGRLLVSQCTDAPGT